VERRREGHACWDFLGGKIYGGPLSWIFISVPNVQSSLLFLQRLHRSSKNLRTLERKPSIFLGVRSAGGIPRILPIRIGSCWTHVSLAGPSLSNPSPGIDVLPHVPHRPHCFHDIHDSTIKYLVPLSGWLGACKAF